MHEHETQRPSGGEGFFFPPPEPGRHEASPPQGYTAAAWTVIIVIVLLMIVGPRLAERIGEPSREDHIGIMLMEFQAKYTVAAKELTEQQGMAFREHDYTRARDMLNQGTVGQRHRFIIVAAELRGVEEARGELEQLDLLIETERARRGFELDEREARTQRILRDLYAGHSDTLAPNVEALDQDQRDWLVDELGWFGELALGHAEIADDSTRADVIGRAWHVLLSVLVAVIAGGFVGLAGFVGLIVMAVLGFKGRLGSGLRTGGGPHGIYAETFAVWLVVFFGLQIALSFAVKSVPHWALSITFVAFFASLVTLAWPVVRGVPWKTARRDFGLTLGERPPLEPVFGVAGYAMALPFLFLGLLMTVVLIAIQSMFAGAEPDVFGSTAGPAHPVISEVVGRRWWPKVQVLLLAAVAAPVVEEIMFRGVLYRHLREATREGGFVLSVFISAVINSFIFAIIHPQGWVAVPALGSLAFAFCLAREWRGTVLVPIIMHAISNGIIMGVVIFVLAA